MTLFDYKCVNCNLMFEKQVRNLEEIVICPACSTSTERQFPTGGTFILKGDGWEKDGYEKPSTSSNS